MPKKDQSDMPLARAAFAFSILALLVACDSKPTTDTPPPIPALPNIAPISAIPSVTLQPVYTVDAVTFEVRESFPVQLVIKARGTVRTGGWSKAELKPLQTLMVEQGVRSFTFVALAPGPDMMVTQALATIEATYTIPALPTDVKSIRIIGETNEIVQKLP
jgi:hypothetical protein